jgi:hypothetical protein
MDFSSLTSEEKQVFMAGLDGKVVNFPTHYMAEPQQFASAAEQQHLQQLLSSFGIAISGNLPYLVYLEHHHQLSNLLATGTTATMNYLNKNHLIAPFLLQITTT